MIIPLAQAFTLDPTWSARCTAIMTDLLQSGNFMIFDPSTVLTPASNMVAIKIHTRSGLGKPDNGARIPAHRFCFSGQACISTYFPLDAGNISPDDPGRTTDNTAITPGSSGILAMGTSKFSLPGNSVFTAAGQLITPNPSSSYIAGTAFSAGGPAVTVDSTVVSLGPSGVLNWKQYFYSSHSNACCVCQSTIRHRRSDNHSEWLDLLCRRHNAFTRRSSCHYQRHYSQPPTFWNSDHRLKHPRAPNAIIANL